MKDINTIKTEILNLLEENYNNETCRIESEDIKVGWHRTVALINESDTDISCDEEIPYEEVLEIMSKKHNVSKDKVEFFYEGYVFDKKGNNSLEFFEGIVGYKHMIDSIKNFISSKRFDSEMEKSNFKQNLYQDYAVKELWRDKNKEYKDERYVAIVRTKGNEKWYFNELFDYLKENNQDDIYKIYQAREKTEVLYIAKSKLNDISKSEIPSKIKSDIETVINKEENCGFCENTTYVNTHPYVYDDFGGCVGRLYACPVCLDLYDLKVSPESNYKKSLNGEEKMDMYDFVYNKSIKFYNKSI